MAKANLGLTASYENRKSLINLGELEGVKKAINPAELEDREGYNPDFLDGWHIPFPLATGLAAKDMTTLKDSREVELKYTHFSIVMSRSRKMTMAAGSNIAGDLSVKIKRDNDKWYLDGRIDESLQFGNELYKQNRLDRGHMVRREDPVWGEDAATANEDTFCYPNACPQMDNFNQRTWLELENYILQNARVDSMRISVFTGPIFSHADLEYNYEGDNVALIPSAYWKVIAFLAEDGRPCATAYKISQDKELGELEFLYGKFKTYQISINQVIDETNLDFSSLTEYDVYSDYEQKSGKRLKVNLSSPEDIVI